jgi:lipopolysaccharide transport system permease protein
MIDMIEAESTPIVPAKDRNGDPLHHTLFDDVSAGAVAADDGPDLLHETVIRPRSGWIGINWQEMWSHRELLVFLVWRDISIRYKQTVLGWAWAILQPLIMMSIFSLIFGRFVKIEPPNNIPYPVFVFAGLIPWTLFSQGLMQSAMSLVNQQQLLTKVYFPRLFVPVSAACVFLVDLLVSLVIYAVILYGYGMTPSWGSLGLVFLIPMTLVATLGYGVTLAALTVFYRDFKHIVPFLVQILMFVTPVVIPVEYMTRRWRPILALNPIFGIINAYRSAILGTEWDWPSLAISTVSGLAMFTFAIFYFRKTERRFADFA